MTTYELPGTERFDEGGSFGAASSELGVSNAGTVESQNGENLFGCNFHDDMLESGLDEALQEFRGAGGASDAPDDLGWELCGSVQKDHTAELGMSQVPRGAKLSKSSFD